MPRAHYTYAELQQKLPRTCAQIAEQEAALPELRPVPPLSVDECRELLLGAFDQAVSRCLTPAEAVLAGQLLAQYRQAVRAQTLGYHGRYYCVSEAELSDLLTRADTDV